ncbi:acyltransferase domain-containing protein, partial [Streptomyces sp. RPT161]|uniref:acyltransferase domain-containing protein n=1 Tax=Streptomyces sp. RPT161 TaxID=3015993 RepID=UPI0022B9179D
PTSIVIAGDETAALEIAAGFEEQGRKTKRLTVSHAFHSPHMDGMLDAFREVAAGLTYETPRIPIVSTLTGTLVTAEEIGTAEYWVRHVRQAVRFLDGIRVLEDQNVTTYVELGPDGVLSAMAQDCVTSQAAIFVPVLRRDRPEPETVTTALAQAHVNGVPVDWKSYFTGSGARRVDLPTYAFQRQRYWLESPTAQAAAPAADTVDARFWEAVEREDLESLAATLDVEAGEDSALEAVLPALSAWRRQQRERSAVDGWRYRVTWKPVTDRPTQALTGTWLLVVPTAKADDELVTTITRSLSAKGVEVQHLTVDPTHITRSELATRLTETEPANGVLSLLALDERTAVVATALLTQALDDAAIDAPLWCVTRGAVCVGRSDRLASADQAAIWGLGRVAAMELPGRWGGLVDVPEVLDERAAARLTSALAGLGDEDQVAVRPAGTFGRRLVRASQDGAEGNSWTPRGTVLVTG